MMSVVNPLIIMFLPIMTTGIFGNVYAQIQPPCAAELQGIDGELGYRPRGGDRCEGLYRSLTSGGIELLSFIRVDNTHLVETPHHIQLRVPQGRDGIKGTVAIRVRTLRENIYYQLDSSTTPGKIFSWSTSEVLEKVGLTSQDLGFLGWFVDSGERVFVPLDVQFGIELKEKQDAVIFLIHSPLKIEWVKWRIYTTTAHTEPMRWQSVTGGNFPPGWPIEIQLPRGLSGTYIIDVYALPENRDVPERLSARLQF